MHGVTTERCRVECDRRRTLVPERCSTPGRTLWSCTRTTTRVPTRSSTTYAVLEADPRFRIFPSLRFEAFLTLLRNAQCDRRQLERRYPRSTDLRGAERRHRHAATRTHPALDDRAHRPLCRRDTRRHVGRRADGPRRAEPAVRRRRQCRTFLRAARRRRHLDHAGSTRSSRHPGQRGLNASRAGATEPWSRYPDPTMARVVLLTSNELRHRFVRARSASTKGSMSCARTASNRR